MLANKGFKMKMWHIGLSGLTLAAVAGVAFLAGPLMAAPVVEPTDRFSELDYRVFDREFQLGDEVCAVGIKARRLCFSESPLQTQIAKGERLQQHIPVLAAEFHILKETPPKAKHQKLLRYGTKLVLLNENTQVIEDIIELGPKQA